MTNIKECLRCGETFPEKGKVKNYCSENCRSAAAMERKRSREQKFKIIERDLRNNHRILSSFMDRKNVRLEDLRPMGFRAGLHTGRFSYGDTQAILYYNIGVVYRPDGTLKIIDTDEI